MRCAFSDWRIVAYLIAGSLITYQVKTDRRRSFKEMPFPPSRVKSIEAREWLPIGNFFRVNVQAAILRTMPTEHATICAAGVIFRLLRGRWAPPLLVLLAERGPLHFLAIFRLVPGISRKVLTEQLRYLERVGVVARSTEERRQQVFYFLTPRGYELKEAIDGLNEVAHGWPEV